MQQQSPQAALRLAASGTIRCCRPLGGNSISVVGRLFFTHACLPPYLRRPTHGSVLLCELLPRFAPSAVVQSLLGLVEDVSVDDDDDADNVDSASDPSGAACICVSMMTGGEGVMPGE